jgi:RNA 3'-phosphate cyclase
MKYEFDLDIKRRGHYPRGGGKVIANFQPVKFLNSLKVIDYEGIRKIKGISHCVKLPKHVALRQKDTAISSLRRNNFSGAEIELEYYKKEEDPHLGAGSGIVLWAVPDNEIPIGGDSYGARGKKAEVVGREAVENLMKELNTRASVDIHAADMLIPYLGLARGKSIIRVRKLSNHIKTNIKITKKILKNKCKIREIDKDLFEIEVEGISYKNKYME